jgi:TRAP transporter TAXI family solute receptor
MGAAMAADLPPYVNIATQAVGTSYYAVGAGIAKIITDMTPINATVLPYSGPDEWMVDVTDGTVTLGLLSAIDLAWAYTGTVNYDEPYDELRLVASGNWSYHTTMTVREDSDIMSYFDLAGHKIGYEYGGNKLTVLLVDAALASAGLTIEDCVPIPLADLSTAQRALQERRVEVIFTGSNTTPSSVELDTAIGLRVLPLAGLTPEDIADGVPEEVQSVLDEYVPGATAKVAPAAGTLDEPTVLISYPIQLCASTVLTDDDVYAITKAIYENYQQLAEVNVWGKSWTPENFVIDSFSVPYHDGAIRFFKEVGLWTEAAQARQDMLLNK